MAPARSSARVAAWAAFVKAATYVAGFVVLGAYLGPAGFGEGGPEAAVAFLVEHQGALYAWYAVLYLLGGLALVALVLGVRDRLRRGGPLLAQGAVAVGLIWSGLLLASGMVALVGQRAVVDLHAEDPDRAATVWAALAAVQDALGGGIELVGGVWILLVAWGWREGVGRGLRLLGTGIGIAGILTMLPGSMAAAAAFGLGFIAWFVWAGIVLWRTAPTTQR